jgi:putative membrane protein
MDNKDTFWLRIIYIISIITSLTVAFLILGSRPAGLENFNLDVSALPYVNALLNTITTILLITALIFIKNKKIKLHQDTMITAFGTSLMFLISYIVYHWFKSGPKQYVGEFKLFYYSILISHILLAMIIIPLSLITLYRGWNSQIEKHRKIAKITFPIWLYVSVTGIIIYLMLY